MSQELNIVASVIIFLTGLVLFKAIFPALGITLVFLLLMAILEIAWEYRETPFVLTLVNLAISAILTLALYALIFLPLEFLITEILFVTPKISHTLSLSLLILLVIVFSLVDWTRVLRTRSYHWLLVVLVVVSGFVHGIYQRHKLAREYLPKIYRAYPTSGIQAQRVEIKGVNFFPVWKRGKVFLGGDEMVIRFWNEELIVAEQPVPSKFGQVNLFVVRSDGVISNKVPFEIKNPAELKDLWKP